MASVVGGVVSAVGGFMSARNQKKAAQAAAAGAQFNPWNISGPGGGVNFSNGTARATDSAENAMMRGGFSDVANMGFQNALMGPGQVMSAMGAGAMPGAFQGAMDASQFIPSQAFGQFGNLAGGQAGALNAFGMNALQNSDFSALAQDQLSRMRAQARPGEERAVNAKFQNLFNRGALSATSGERQIGELALSQEMADIQRSMNADQFANVLQQQNRNFGLGAMGQALGAGQAGLQSQIGFADMTNQRAQQRMQNAFQMFGMGQDTTNNAINQAMTANQGIQGINATNRANIALGANMGAAGASAGAQAGQLAMQGAHSPMGSFLGAFGGAIPNFNFGGFGGGGSSQVPFTPAGSFGGGYNPFAGMFPGITGGGG